MIVLEIAATREINSILVSPRLEPLRDSRESLASTKSEKTIVAIYANLMGAPVYYAEIVAQDLPNEYVLLQSEATEWISIYYCTILA